MEYAKGIRERGNKLILWTCRNGDRLKEAIDWCKDLGLEFDQINENDQERIDMYGEDTRKISADYYIDDRAITVESIVGGEVRTTNRKTMQTRSQAAEFRAAEADGKKYIEGYFSVFGGTYELWPGATESVDSRAFDEALGDDIRALINHDTTLVIGRNKAGTLDLKVDSRGLWGRSEINEKDQDALNLYARVERGDVDQCSFGFDILDEETEYRDDGTVHWTIKKVKLYEVSVCTFPAYEDTSVQARKKDYEQIRARRHEVWKARMKERLQKWH